ncbi:MAG: carotenoid oxygenase family protein [Methylobacter sp.]|nr:carotenoid oxygenase family protein [Methylobacter sp.]
MTKPASLNHSVTRTHAFETLTVDGTLPTTLRGTLFRAGPGLLERFGRTVAHPFEADGAITAVRIGDGVQGACRIVEAEEYRLEEKLGKSLYGSTASPFARLHNGLTQTFKNTGNTNVLAWQGRCFALVESGKPVEMDVLNLDTKNATDLGVIQGAFSAHPHRVEALKTTFNFGLRGKHIDLYALPDTGSARWLGSFEAPWISMVHDFIATDRHLIFFIGPAKLVAWRAMLGLKDFTKYFRWDNRAGTMIVIVPLADPAHPMKFEVDAFWVWHFVNAFEDGEDIMVDAIRHDDFSVFASPVDLNANVSGEPALWRFRLSPKQGGFSGEPLRPFPCEFPSVHPRYVGAEHRTIWLQTYTKADGTEGAGVGRFDTQTRQTQYWHSPEGHLGSEPVFVPEHGDAPEGWLLQLLQDPEAKRSYLAVLDSERLDAGPVAKVWFNQAIPMTFHGVFVPKAKI